MATHSEVAHRWAQDDHTARTVRADRMFYEREGDGGPHAASVIFSHGTHWPLASFIDSPHGRVVLVNEEGYSVSTRQHLGHVRGALYDRQRGERDTSHQGYPIFGVRYVDPLRTPGGGLDTMHRLNREWLLEHAAAAYEEGTRRRSERRRDWDYERANGFLNTARRYAAAFDQEPVPAEMAEVAAQITAEAGARAAAIELERQARAKREAEHLAGQRLDNADAFIDWRMDKPGSSVPAGYYASPDGFAYVRRHRAPEGDTLARPIEEVGDVLQTSQGASVPFRDAVRVYKLAASQRAKGEPLALSLRVGHYTLTQIGADGSITVGCHHIGFAEMHRLAVAEGVAVDGVTCD